MKSSDLPGYKDIFNNIASHCHTAVTALSTDIRETACMSARLLAEMAYRNIRQQRKAAGHDDSMHEAPLSLQEIDAKQTALSKGIPQITEDTASSLRYQFGAHMSQAGRQAEWVGRLVENGEIESNGGILAHTLDLRKKLDDMVLVDKVLRGAVIVK